MKAHREIVFHVEKEDRDYRMYIPEGAPLGEAYEASGAFMDKLVELIKENTANKPKLEKAKEEAEEKKEENE